MNSMRNFLTWNPEFFKLEASMGSSVERFPYQSLRTLIPLTLMCRNTQFYLQVRGVIKHFVGLIGVHKEWIQAIVI